MDLTVALFSDRLVVPALVPSDCLAGPDWETGLLSEMVPEEETDLLYCSGCVLANNVSPSLLDSGLEYVVL